MGPPHPPEELRAYTQDRRACRGVFGGVAEFAVNCHHNGRQLTEAAVRSEEREFKRVETWLGGPKVIRHRLRTKTDVHEVTLRGLPIRSVIHLLGVLLLLQRNDGLEKAMGVSLRTVQRRKALNSEQSGRTLKFAEIVAKATEVFGSQQAAEEWLERPAMGLDDKIPMELLATPAGREMVEDFLTRTEYGAYT